MSTCILSLRYFPTAVSSESKPSSLQAPTKFAPLSERRSLAGPRIEKNLINALIKLSVYILSISSICTALVNMHVNNTAQRLLWAQPPLVRRVTIFHGPNTSKPTVVKGGSGVTRSAGKSAIFRVCILPRNFRHMTHL